MKMSMHGRLPNEVPGSDPQRLLFIFFLISGIIILLLPIGALLEELGLWPWEESGTFVVILIFAIAAVAFWLLQMIPFLFLILLRYRKNRQLSLPLILLLLSLIILFAGRYIEPQTSYDQENLLPDILDYAGMILLAAYAVTAVVTGIRGLRRLRR